MHDVLIIGGGVIGLSIAYEAAGRGLSVVLCEQGPLGSEASWAGAGIIPAGANPDLGTPLQRLHSASNLLWPGLTEELREATGIDNGYVRCGGICIARGPDQRELQAQFDEWQQTGVEHAVLSHDESRRCEPQFAPGPDDVVCRIPAVAQVRNPRHLKALIAACSRRGVEFRTGETVLGFRREGGRVSAVSTSTGDCRADQFVVAGGAWSNSLLASCGFHADIVPVRGQIVLLSMQALPFRHVIECGPRYLVPRPDGRVLVGSTEEWVGFNKGNTSSGVQGLLQFAEGLVPALADARFETCWSGLRPHSPRSIPFIGRVPEHDNLLVATGHFRSGLSLSPITARLVVQQLAGETPELPLTELGLAPA